MYTDNQALIRRLFEEVLNGGDLALIDTLYASNVVDRNYLRGRVCGRENIRRTLVELRVILLGLQVVVERLSAEADIVVTHEIWCGTHVCTGRWVTGPVTHIFRIHNSQIIEEWSGGWEWLDGTSI